MNIQFISLFPNVLAEYLNSSMLYKAQNQGLLNYQLINLRQFGLGPRQQVDDYPYGGGQGMLLMIEPLHKAINYAKTQRPDATVVLMTPKGQLLSQTLAKDLVKSEVAQDLIIICPHYEGYDERLTQFVDRQISIGQYILTGGELPALVLADCLVRLIPGVLASMEAISDESFYQDLQQLEHPQYTRPQTYCGLEVPAVLLSGHHQQIKNWQSSNQVKLDVKLDNKD